MSIQEYNEARMAILADVRKVHTALFKSPSIERWCQEAHPVDREAYVDRVRKVLEGAMELLWIADNDYIWQPEPGANIHRNRGAALRKIQDFIDLKPTIQAFNNPYCKCNLIEEAADVAAAINWEDANDRVWNAYNAAINKPQPSIIDGEAQDSTKAAAPKKSRKDNRSFASFIQHPNPDIVLKEMHKHIDGKKGKSAALFIYHAIRAKILSERPTPSAIKSEFGFTDEEFENLRGYLSTSRASNAEADNIKFSFEA